MPRTARIVVPDVAHHVTQRGNRRLQTFFGPEDYQRYLELLGAACATARVAIVSYCLMPNHVHLVLVPSDATGLTAAMANTHQKYAWLINRRQGWTGHLWQQRYYSFPLDEGHLLTAVRYVELNPVRARLVATPHDWPWSSAPERSGLTSRNGLMLAPLPPPLDTIADWDAYLQSGSEGEDERQRAHQLSGRPLGEDAFVQHVAARLGRNLVTRPRGRPPLRHEVG